MNAPRIPALHCSEAGLRLIRGHEGLRIEAYRDAGGVPTIGYGHTRGVRMGQTISREQAELFLREDVAEAEDTIRAYVSPDTLDVMPQEAFDALVDFVFNLGHQAFRNPKTGSSTGIARALEGRRFADVPNEMRRWVYDNGQKLPGLIVRRENCVRLWNSAAWAGVA